LFDEIGENAQGIVNQINELSSSSSPTVLLLNSPGGSVLAGAQIISAIEGSHAPVYAVVTGICASMCALITEYSNKRFMTDRSLLMFHPAAGMFQGMFPNIESRFKTFDRYTKKMDAHVAKRVGISLDKFLTMINNELWLDSEDALDQKFIDGIVRIDMSGIGLSNSAGSETLNKLDIYLKD
jgi:ATP-dependent Clp protease protease subunit